MKSAFWVLGILLALNGSGQDTLTTLNGKQYAGYASDTTGVKLFFNWEKPSGKIKEKTFYRDQVFSIKHESGSEHLFYYPNLYFMDDYTIENMRLEVFGRIDGKSYQTKWVVPVGLGSGMLAGYFLKGSGFTALFPMVYVGAVQIPIVQIQHESISNPAFFGDSFYAGGYDRSARFKRTTHALVSSFVGVIAGFALYEVTK